MGDRQKERNKLKRREARLARHKKRRVNMFMQKPVGDAPDAKRGPISSFMASILMRGHRRRKTNTLVNEYNKRLEKRRHLRDGQEAMAKEAVT